ncbi:hypothetical protein AMJ83_03055 [candidate division WOR_3 bacterium SM23_42]|uniref:DUF2905 domain-containing protein n=1 Tax=candidate division WOR_3 bacterium SM23_42 TaxID=1703779 RepID=A0A0S8FU06_UNCW3|nr:MAG: hypothetical protein AMJ83_03055 [candidate division WOR_3 bacterium SM23_42]
MHGVARFLILLGIVFLVLGGLLLLFPKISSLRMPGDIVIKQDNFVMYFPIMTSIIISIILTIILNFILRR